MNLYYLVTPLHADPIKAQQELGKVMRIFHDNGLVYIRSANQPLQELRITLCRMDLEEHTRLWDALGEKYRLSVCYRANIARIDSERVRRNVRIVEQETDYSIE